MHQWSIIVLKGKGGRVQRASCGDSLYSFQLLGILYIAFTMSGFFETSGYIQSRGKKRLKTKIKCDCVSSLVRPHTGRNHLLTDVERSVATFICSLWKKKCPKGKPHNPLEPEHQSLFTREQPCTLFSDTQGDFKSLLVNSVSLYWRENNLISLVQRDKDYNCRASYI